VFIDGQPFGPAVDQGSESGVWAWFQGPSVPGPVLSPGQHTVTAKGAGRGRQLVRAQPGATCYRVPLLISHPPR
jgi:hypothetical protein